MDQETRVAKIREAAAKLLALEIPEGADFDMSCYMKHDGLQVRHVGEAKDVIESCACGTVGCAIGWLGTIYDVDGYIRFCEVSRVLFDIHPGDDEWEWMFSEVWSCTDNTKEGAALRMLWYAAHGLPGNWHEQIRGDEPLCYR